MEEINDKKSIKTWLSDVKFQLRISPEDTSADSLLQDYIAVAYNSIWTNYYGLTPPVEGGVSLKPEWDLDVITKLATIHLTITLFSNPDENQEGSNIVDDRMIFRILGDRIKWGN